MDHAACRQKWNMYDILVGKADFRDFRVSGIQDGKQLTWILNENWGVNWTHLFQDREQWRALVDTLMNNRISQKTKTLYFDPRVTIKFTRTAIHGTNRIAFFQEKDLFACRRIILPEVTQKFDLCGTLVDQYRFYITNNFVEASAISRLVCTLLRETG
jgi:hypothetical protein